MKIHLVLLLKNLLNHKLIGLFFPTLLYFCSTFSNAQTIITEGYQLSKIDAEPYTQVIQRSGKVNFARVVNVSFKAVGFLTELNIDEGDTFEAKQLLAALDISELKAEKNATYARLLQAKRNTTRIKTLLKKNLSSQRELDDALTEIETTRATYRIAFYNLEKAQIYAPFNGVVVKRHTDLGELQSPGIPVLQVANLDDNHIVKVALTGEEIALVHLNQTVKVHLAYVGLVDGRISKIPATADNQSHLFTIEVALSKANLTKPLIVGQLARILIHAKSQDFVYRLPVGALNAVNQQGDALITIEKNNKLEQHAFPIFKIDSDFLYLDAQENSIALDVVTQGWNKLSLNSVER